VSAKEPDAYLAHARDCCARIIEYTRDGPPSLFDDQKTQDAVLRNLEIIGQCFKDANLILLEAEHPDIPWRDVAAFRNILAHAYLGVELTIVWDIIEHQIPQLHAQLNQILENWNP
jgi:uncharacterized protein with HEPN domain